MPSFIQENYEQAANLIAQTFTSLPPARGGDLFNGVLFDTHIGHRAIGFVYFGDKEDGELIMTSEIVSVGVILGTHYVETSSKSRYIIANTQICFNQIGDVHQDLLAKALSISESSEYYKSLQWSA